MSFPVTIPASIQLEALRAQVSANSRVAISELSRPVLPIGKIVEIIVSNNGQLQTGVLLQGKYYSAELPKDSKNGQRMQAQVVSNDSALILRLLGTEDIAAETAPQAAVPKSPLARILSEIADPPRIKSLREAISYSTPQIRQPLENSASEDPHIESKHPLQIPPSAPQALKEFVQRQLLASEAQLVDSRKLVEVLDKFVRGDLVQSKQLVHEVKERHTQVLRAKLTHTLAQNIETQIAALLDSEQPLFTPKESAVGVAPLFMRQYLQLTLTLTRYAADQRDSSSVGKIVQALTQQGKSEAPLGLFLKNLALLEDLSQSGVIEPQSPFLSIVRNLLDRLGGQVHNDKERDEGAIRTALAQARTSLKELLGKPAAVKVRDDNEAIQAGMLNALDALLQGQETLSSFNQLVQVFGEPALVLIPALLGDNLVSWQLSIHPDTSGEDSGRHASGERTERIGVKASFPALGRVLLDVAKCQTELFVRIRAEDQGSLSMIKDRQANLIAALKKLGFENITLNWGIAEEHEDAPQWLRSLIGTQVRV